MNDSNNEKSWEDVRDILVEYGYISLPLNSEGTKAKSFDILTRAGYSVWKIPGSDDPWYWCDYTVIEGSSDSFPGAVIEALNHIHEMKGDD